MKSFAEWKFTLVSAASIGIYAAWAVAQDGQGEPAAASPAPPTSGDELAMWKLFTQSFDLFTVLLIASSVIAWTVVFRCIIEIRAKNILCPESEQTIRRLGVSGQWEQIRGFVAKDKAFVSKVVNAALSRRSKEKSSVHDAAELAASEECARWFRMIEPLNVIGNLGPLLGLSGTVYGMVIAFAALGAAGGQASPANLSLGISKALFHTLLGLLVAVPALAVFGFYRARVDRLCNRAMAISAELVDTIPAGEGATRSAAASQQRLAPMSVATRAMGE